MTGRICRATSCDALTTRYGVFCSTHKSTNRRHGAPDQRGITKSDLKPYLTIVQRRINANEALGVWALLDQQWIDLVQHARGFLTGVVAAWTRRAAQEVMKLAGAVEPRTAVEMVLAIYLMQQQAGHRFKSDRAFDTQLVRRLRGLPKANAKVSTGPDGRLTRVYTELPPRVTSVLAKWLHSFLGKVGVWFAQQEQACDQRQEQVKHQLQSGLAQIDFS